MAAALAPAFFDTSVLIGGLIRLAGAEDASQRILDALAEGKLRSAHTAWHCCLEFYAVTTRLPLEYRLGAAEAVQLIESEILKRMKVHHLPPDGRTSFLRSLAQDALVGGRAYDAHIGEIARRAGLRILVTHNRKHFLSLTREKIQVLAPESYWAMR